MRHASHAGLDKLLLGRRVDPGLSAAGRAEARALAEECAAAGVAAVQSSPRRRALETAGIVAARLGCEVEIAPALDEVEFGDWSGQSFDALLDDPRWRRWNEARGAARCPGGEAMSEVRRRALAHVLLASRRQNAGPVVMVSHAEIIRTLVLVARELPYDAWASVEVPPASLTMIDVARGCLTLGARGTGAGRPAGDGPGAGR